MAIGVTIAIPGGNAQVYDQIIGKVFPDSELPEWRCTSLDRLRTAGG